MSTQDELIKLVEEAGELLQTARWAMMKSGLSGRGSDCRLPHELRMFALDFSHEHRDGPGELQINGTGRVIAWNQRANEVLKKARGDAA